MHVYSGAWNVGRVTDFSYMFRRTTVTAFNNGDPLNTVGTGMQNWNIGANLTGTTTINMRNMFTQADAFSQDIGTWDVGRVTNFYEMFYHAGRFTGAGLDSWSFASASNVDPTETISMFRMFRDCSVV